MKQAVKDPRQRPLFKSSDVAWKLGSTNSRFAMYIARRRAIPLSGIYKCEEFEHRLSSRKDLKLGGYFVSLDVCEQFAAHLKHKQK